MSIVKKYLPLFILSTIISIRTLGQAAESPFTTFGIGERYGNAMVHNQGMGGVGIGTPQYWFLNNQNPALLVYNTLTIFEAGIIFESKKINSDTLSEKSQAGNLNYLAMSFPIKPEKWTSSIGLMPYTNVDYRLQYQDPIMGSTNTATTTEVGSGGLTQVYWSNGVKLTPNLALGLKAAYIFSSVNNEYSNYVNDPSLPATYKVSVAEQTYVRDFMFTGGISYKLDSVFGGKYTFAAGAIYSFATNLNTKKTVKFSRDDLLDNVIDSLTLQSVYGSLHIPQEIGFGFSVGKIYKWTFGADFHYQDWSDFKSVDSEDEQGLTASWAAMAGFELTPDIYAVDNFFKRMTYRGGVSMEKYPFLVNNRQVKDFGINFGFSVPAGRSSLNMAFRVGKRGNKSENILEETYYKVYFGITLNDQWFIKRKFD
ncbi:MAG TPA: hypothetical protein VFW11_15215 [Cyclobacteriaceae bacterium]|nr:hypothetical protein [Cyclobacteriaceae bacterium]